MITRFQGMPEGHPVAATLLAFQCIPVLVLGVMCLYLWASLIRRARNAYSKDTATLSVKEWTFIVYSATAITTSTVIFYSRGNTTLENSTLQSLLSRECVVIASAVAWALLPARIARSRAKMTQSRWKNAKRDVTTLLNSPLKLVCNIIATTTYPSLPFQVHPIPYIISRTLEHTPSTHTISHIFSLSTYLSIYFHLPIGYLGVRRSHMHPLTSPYYLSNYFILFSHHLISSQLSTNLSIHLP